MSRRLKLNYNKAGNVIIPKGYRIVSDKWKDGDLFANHGQLFFDEELGGGPMFQYWSVLHYCLDKIPNHLILIRKNK
jgi:hypothetical protein